MSLGEWLDAVLHESDAGAAPRAPGAAPSAEEERAGSDTVENRLDRLVSAIGTDSNAGSETGADDGPHSLRGIARRLDRLSAAVPEGPERRSTRETIRELEERLHDIARRVESRQRPAFSRPAAPVHPDRISASPMEGLKEAIAEIASRQKTLEVEFDRAVSGYADRVDHRIDIVAERLERTLDEALPSEELKQLHKSLSAIAANGGARASEIKEFAELRLMVTEMARRIETMPDQVAEDLAGRLEDTVRRLDTATRSEVDAIRGELREIAQDVDRSTRGEFEAVRAEIGQLAARIETMPVADVQIIESKLEDIAMRLSASARDEIGAIRADVREIAEQMDNAGRGAIEAMRAEMARLSERFDTLPASAGSDVEMQLDEIASRFDNAARGEIEALRAELRELGERLFAERTAFAATNSIDEAGLAELDSIRTEIRSLAEQIDGVRRDDYAALRRDVQALGERMSDAPNARMGELEKQIAQLTEKLAGAARDGDPEVLAQIEQQISNLAQTVDASARQTVDMGGLERTISDLFTRIEESRADTMHAAREAANEAIERALSTLGTSPGGAEIVGALRDELTSQRRDAEASDLRTQEALQLVHATLMTVADRLEELEDEVDEVAGDMRQPGRAAGEEPAPEVRPEPKLEAEPVDKHALVATDRAAKAEAKKAARTDTAAPTATIEDDMPLAPGTGRPVRAPGATDTEAGSQSDFVAAARRAAQAATAEQGEPPAAAAKAKKSALGGLRSGLAKYRRPLAIAAAMLLLVYGAMKIAAMLKSAPESSSALEPPAVASSAPPLPAISAAPPVASAPRNVTANASSAQPTTAKPVAAKPIRKDPAKVGAKTATKSGAGKKPKNAKAGNREKSPTKSARKAVVLAPAAPVTAVSTGSIPNPAKAKAEMAPESGASGNAAPAQPTSSEIDELPTTTVPEKLREAAASGDPGAEFEVAVRYMDGRGLPQNASKAVEWYRKAAAQGLAPAQYRLGSLYEKGEGVDRDLAMARMWYQRAAEQGNRKAMHNLAVLYADGVDGKPDYEKAAMWFRQAAEYGLADSQFNLAVLYARGLGVQTDYGESFRWFAIAADQGDGEALQKRDEVARQLDQESLAKAREALDAWTPKPADASANVVAEPQGGWGEAAQNRQAYADRDMVISAQDMLNKLGYTAGPPDGQIGPRTREAVRAFQRSVGMPDTGDITPELLEQLDKTAG